MVFTSYVILTYQLSPLQATLGHKEVADKKVQELWEAEQQVKQLMAMKDQQQQKMAMAAKKMKELWEIEQHLKKFSEIKKLQIQLINLQKLKKVNPADVPTELKPRALGSCFSDVPAKLYIYIYHIYIYITYVHAWSIFGKT